MMNNVGVTSVNVDKETTRVEVQRELQGLTYDAISSNIHSTTTLVVPQDYRRFLNQLGSRTPSVCLLALRRRCSCGRGRTRILTKIAHKGVKPEGEKT